MDDQERNILLSALIISGSFIVSLTYTSLSEALFWTFAASATAGTVYYLWKNGYLESFNNRLEQVGNGLFTSQKDLNQLWNDLQEWEAEDPRNTELIWHPVATSVKYSTPNPNEDFMFISFVSPYKEKNVFVPGFRLHVVIEASTGFIVQHTSVKYKSELYDNPFENVPIVQDMKRGLISGEEVVSKLNRNGYGRVGGGGYTAFDRSTELQPVSAEVGEEDE